MSPDGSQTPTQPTAARPRRDATPLADLRTHHLHCTCINISRKRIDTGLPYRHARGSMRQVWCFRDDKCATA
jgi:hypothetical protein